MLSSSFGLQSTLTLAARTHAHTHCETAAMYEGIAYYKSIDTLTHKQETRYAR